MFSLFRRGLSLVLCLALLLPAVPMAQASEEPLFAESIGSVQLVTETVGVGYCDPMFDGVMSTSVTISDRSRLTMESALGIGSIYVIFDLVQGPWTVTDNGSGRTYRFGTEGFLHDFWDLEAVFGTAPTSIDICFTNGTAEILEMYVFTAGRTPAFVQKWSEPEPSRVDLTLFSTHGDDEQLFFAGLLPYYAGELDYQVLVVYLTDHYDKLRIRRHEMLDGLWAVGVDIYPVLGPFGDYYTSSGDDAYKQHARHGESKTELQEFVVEQIRKYKPMVAVGHDLRYGEYGHGQHIMYADLLCYALEAANDPALHADSANRWGTWDVPKTYLHLWPENRITMDWDQPLSKFDGMTAYQVTKYLGFPEHESQQDNFRWFMKDEERADEFTYLSPREYGLYRSLVGPDEEKQDMFEHLVTYTLQRENPLS